MKVPRAAIIFAMLFITQLDNYNHKDNNKYKEIHSIKQRETLSFLLAVTGGYVNMRAFMGDLKAKDWVLITIIAVTLIGCIVQFQRRSMLLYFFVPFVFAVFFFVESRMEKGKLVIVKKIGLFLGMMFLLYCFIVFVVTSSPIEGRRDQGSGKYLMKLDSMQQVSIPTMNGKGWGAGEME